MKRRNFLFSTLAACFVPIRKIFGHQAVDLTATQFLDIKATWLTGSVNNLIKLGPEFYEPISGDMFTITEVTLAPGESVTIEYDGKTGKPRILK